MGSKRPRKAETEIDQLSKGAGLSINVFQMLTQGFADLDPVQRKRILDKQLEQYERELNLMDKYLDYMESDPDAIKKIRWGQRVDGSTERLAMVFSLMQVQKTKLTASLSTSEVDEVKGLLEKHKENEERLALMESDLRAKLASAEGNGEVIEAEFEEVESGE